MAGNYQNIYDRINAGSSYTPLSAQTFGDWSLEAGDVVTVWKGLNQYTTPVMRSDLEWKGASKVTIESTGNPERAPLNKISKRKYSESTRTGGGYYNSRNHQKRIDTEEEISSQAGMYLDDHGVIVYSTNTETMVGSRFLSLNNRAEMSVGTYKVDVTKLTEYSTRADFPVTGTPGYFYGDASTNKVYSWQADSSATGGGYYVELRLSGDDKLIGYATKNDFPQTGQTGIIYADKSTGKVYRWNPTNQQYYESTMNGHGEGYYIKAAEIATYINDAGEGVAYIDAPKVLLGQSRLTVEDLETWAMDPENNGGVFAKFLTVRTLTAQEIETMFASIGEAEIGDIDALDIGSRGDISAVGDITANGNIVSFDTIIAQDHFEIGDGTNNIVMNICDAELRNSGRTLRIYKIDGSYIDFTKS